MEKPAIALVTLLALLFLPPVAARAASWDAAVSGDWNDAAKWGGTAPNNGNDANLTVDGTYTATINNATVDLSPTTVTNLGWINLANSTTDHPTLIVNFTNASRNVSAQLIALATPGAATPTLQIDQGAVRVNNRLILGGGGVAGGSATLRLVDGSFAATNSGTGADRNNIGGEVGSAGIGFLDQQGGQVFFNVLKVGSDATSVGRWTLSGGTGTVQSAASLGFTLAYAANSTGTVVVAGGTLNSIGEFIVSRDGVGTLITSNGTLNATSIMMGYEGTGKGTWNIVGGTNNISGSVTMNRLEGPTTRFLMEGGELNILSGLFDVGEQGRTLAIATVSNGTVNVNKLSVGGGSDGVTGGEGQMDVFGGLVSATNYLRIAGNAGGGNVSTGHMTVANSGVLEVKGTLALGRSGTSDRGYLTNRDGGTIRFTGLNDPSITVNSGSSFVTTNATIEFMNAGAANLMGSISNLITYHGDNTLRLNAATNANLSSYTFQANNGQRFAFLDLANGGALLATNVTFGSGGKLTGTGAILARSVTNLGTIAPGHSPGVLTFSNDLTLGASSVLNMELAGTNLNLFDRIAVGGAFALNGALNVSLTNGFNPQFGNSFKIFDFSSESSHSVKKAGLHL